MKSPRGGRAWLHEVGVVCALGSGEAALRAALATQRPNSLAGHSPFWPVPLPQGMVTDPLPSLDDWALRYRTRCNAILLACFRQIEAAAREAVARVGAGRVAVVLGTSTAGIGEAQPACE